MSFFISILNGKFNGILFSNSIEIENRQFHVLLSSFLNWISKIELIFKFFE